jgi:hypothetical protein
MTTNLVNEMVDIWVPDEEIVFEAGRKQQDQLFVESQTCDASPVFPENPFLLLVYRVPDYQVGVQTCRSQELKFRHCNHCHYHAVMTFF